MNEQVLHIQNFDLFKYKGEIVQVVKYDGGITTELDRPELYDEGESNVVISELEAIPITEEWLLTHSFSPTSYQKDLYINTTSYFDYAFQYNLQSKTFTLLSRKVYIRMDDCEYIHEIQHMLSCANLESENVLKLIFS